MHGRNRSHFESLNVNGFVVGLDRLQARFKEKRPGAAAPGR